MPLERKRGIGDSLFHFLEQPRRWGVVEVGTGSTGGNTYNISLLNRRSIRLRVREGNSKLYNVSATGLHSKQDGNSGIACRITRRNERDEGGSALELTFRIMGILGRILITSACFSAKVFLRISVI